MDSIPLSSTTWWGLNSPPAKEHASLAIWTACRIIPFYFSMISTTLDSAFTGSCECSRIKKFKDESHDQKLLSSISSIPLPPTPTNPTLWLLFYNYTTKTFWRLQSAHQPVLYGLSSMHTAKKPKAITTIKNAILSRGISAKSLNRYKYLFKFRSVCVRERERRRFSAGKDDQYSLTNNITGSFFPLTDSTTTPHQIITIEQSWLTEQLLHFYSFS